MDTSGSDEEDVRYTTKGTVATTLVLYKRRWWIMSVFIAFTFLQSLSWGMYGSIAANVEKVYPSWDDGTVSLLLNWGPICFLPLSFPLAWLMDSDNGMRRSMLVSGFLLFLGAALRFLQAYWVDPTSTGATVLIHLAQIANASAGPVAMGLAPKLSQDWFPPWQRTTATAITSEANVFGMAGGFLLAPYLVPDPTIQDIQHLQLVLFIASSLTFLATVIYFPSRPPTPPSPSAAEERERLDFSAFLRAVRELCRRPVFLILISVYGASSGVYAGWSSVLNINLKPMGYTEVQCGWMAFVATCVGVVSGLMLGVAADQFRHLRMLLIGMLTASGVAFVGFTLALQGAASWIPCTLPVLFVTSSVGGLAINGAIPLFFELSVEVAYPVPEATVGTVMTNMNNIGCLLFLAVPTDKLGTAWMNWAMVGVCVMGTVGVLLGNGRQLRYEADMRALEGGNRVPGINDGEKDSLLVKEP